MTDDDEPWWLPRDHPAYGDEQDDTAPLPRMPSGTPPADRLDAGPGDRPRRLSAGLAVLLLAIGAAVGAGVTHVVWTRPAGGTSSGGPASTANGPFDASPSAAAPSASGPSVTPAPRGSADAATIARRVSAGLVDITVSSAYQGFEGAGTGMVLTSTGEVLTNNHVISGATRISATDIGNGRTYAATVVGYDRTHDIAVLRLSGATGLATVPFGQSSSLRVGATVVGVGNAGGRGGTPSYAAGTVTALDRQISASDPIDGTSEALTGLVETDAAIVSGDSGGPLVDGNGRVIGVDTAASSGFRFQSAGGRAFAIPIDSALALVDQIDSGRASTTVHIGATAFLGVAVSDGTGPGAQIASVVGGGPAAAAGLAVGDTITSLDGHDVTSPTGLTALMLGERAGSSVGVTYVDTGGAERTTTVVLGSGPPR